MHSYSALFPLLAVSLLNGAPVHSNSPHSPYTQLKVLVEDVNSLKENLEKLKSNDDISEILLGENRQLSTKIELLENENKKLQTQLSNLDAVYKKQTQDLISLSQDFQQFKDLQTQLSDLDGVYKKQKQDLLSLSKDFQKFKKLQNQLSSLDAAYKKQTQDIISLSKDFQQCKDLQTQLSDLDESYKKHTQDIISLSQDFQQFKNLQAQLSDLDEVYKKQTQDLLSLSKDFQKFRSKTKENNNGIKNRDLALVKKDISQIKESLSSTQHEIGNFERRLTDDGARNSQTLQEQLKKIKSELLVFCQETNRRLQDVTEQMKNNLSKATYNGCIKHTIASGESLASIARLYNTTPDQILSANHLQDTRGLHVGDAILVPQEVF